jgi:hypothetical protein
MQLTPWIINKTSIIIIIIIVIIIIIKFNHIIYIYSLHDYPKNNHICFIKIWDFFNTRLYIIIKPIQFKNDKCHLSIFIIILYENFNVPFKEYIQI